MVSYGIADIKNNAKWFFHFIVGIKIDNSIITFDEYGHTLSSFAKFLLNYKFIDSESNWCIPVGFLVEKQNFITIAKFDFPVFTTRYNLQ